MHFSSFLHHEECRGRTNHVPIDFHSVPFELATQVDNPVGVMREKREKKNIHSSRSIGVDFPFETFYRPPNGSKTLAMGA